MDCHIKNITFIIACRKRRVFSVDSRRWNVLSTPSAPCTHHQRPPVALSRLRLPRVVTSYARVTSHPSSCDKGIVGWLQRFSAHYCVNYDLIVVSRTIATDAWRQLRWPSSLFPLDMTRDVSDDARDWLHSIMLADPNLIKLLPLFNLLHQLLIVCEEN